MAGTRWREFRQVAANALRGFGSVGGMERQGIGTTAVGDRGRRGTPLASAHAAAVLRLGLEDRADGTDGRESPDPAGSSRRAAAIGGVTVAMLVAAGIGIPDSGRITANGGTGRGSVEDSPGFTAVGSAMGTQGGRRQEHDQMQTPGIRAALAAGVVMIASGAGAQQPAAVQWRVEDGGNGHWYQAIRTDALLTWSDAQALCIANGGALASLSTQAESTWAFEAIVKEVRLWAYNGPYAVGPWIGGRGPSGNWRWDDGSAWSFATWFPGEGPPSPDPLEQFSYFFAGAGPLVPTNAWGDFFNVPTTPSYLIEWSADCNNDGIVDYGQCRDGSLADLDGDNVPDCCERGEPCVPGFFPKRWRIEDGGNGHWYQLRITGPMTWSNARALAGSIGGHLATPTSGNENQFIVPLANHPKAWVADCCGNTGGPWLGGYQPLDADPSAPWEWVTGNHGRGQAGLLANRTTASTEANW